MILLTTAVILTVILIGLVYKLLGTQIEELSGKVSDHYYARGTDLFNARKSIEARQADAANEAALAETEAARRHRAITSRLDQVYHTLNEMQLERRVKALSNKMDDINTAVHRNSDKLGHVLSGIMELEKPKEAKEDGAKTLSAMQMAPTTDQLDRVIELNRELEAMRASGASGQEIWDHVMTSLVGVAGGRYE